MYHRPGIGEANLGAVAGAAVAAIGGLFAVGIPPSIIGRSISYLFATPKLSFICWLICGPLGWLIGGQIGPRVGQKFRSPRAELIAGGVGGLIPVVLIALWAWYMVVS